MSEGIRVLGAIYDPKVPPETDAGELCVCDWRTKYQPDKYAVGDVVRIDRFPAVETCRLFIWRQKLFCALKKYADACVDLLRANGIEEPSMDL